MALRGYLHINPFDPNTPASVLDLMGDAYLKIMAEEETRRAEQEKQAATQTHLARMQTNGWVVKE